MRRKRRRRQVLIIRPIDKFIQVHTWTLDEFLSSCIVFRFSIYAAFDLLRCLNVNWSSWSTFVLLTKGWTVQPGILPVVLIWLNIWSVSLWKRTKNVIWTNLSSAHWWQLNCFHRSFKMSKKNISSLLVCVIAIVNLIRCSIAHWNSH